jgi:hydrogenase-4 transcriptional activator
VPLVPSPEDLNLLIAYPWPGNVRELAAVIERAAILGDGKRLEMAQALGGAPQRLATREKEENGGDVSRAKTAEPATLDAAMIKHIEAALARTHGRVEGPFGAAALLKINPHTLRARMRKLKIDWKRFRSSPAALEP